MGPYGRMVAPYRPVYIQLDTIYAGCVAGQAQVSSGMHSTAQHSTAHKQAEVQPTALLAVTGSLIEGPIAPLQCQLD
jgi:hypothetical protein